MNTPEWKQRIYDSYMSNGFEEVHNKNKEFEMHNRYFRKNYLEFMPKNKSCKVLELGCGMGQFFYFCKKNGYLNYTGIDASAENIEYIKKIFDDNPDVFVADIISYLSSQKIRGGGVRCSST